MRRVALSALLLALVPAACATGPATPPSQITRFHPAQPIARGTVAVVRREGDPGDLEFRAYAAALTPAIERAGFRVVPDPRSADLVAVVDVQRNGFMGPSRAPAFSIGIGGASFGRHTGVGLGTGVGIGGTRGGRPGTETNLSVQLRDQAGQAVWEGRGRTAGLDGTPGGDGAQSVARVATALFADFPGESGRTITVR